MSEIENLIHVHERNKEILKRWSVKTDLKYIRTRPRNAVLKKNLPPHHELKIRHKKNDFVLLDLFDRTGSPTKSYCYVRVIDSSTGEHCFLSVPGHMGSCKQAIAWTFNLKISEYNPIEET